MLLICLLITTTLWPSFILAFPVAEVLELSERYGLHKRCGPVSSFYNQQSSDWNANNLNGWLDTWWSNHSAEIQSKTTGFAGAFGQWAIGNPDWSCRDDGSDSNCELNLCDNRVLNDKGPDIRQAYYVLESINRLQNYFRGLGESFEVSAIGAALSKDSWATKFYKDKDVKSVTILREILNLVVSIVGIGAAFAGLGGAAAGAAGGAIGAIMTGAAGAVTPVIGQHQDDTFQKSADLGAILGRIVVGSLQSFTSANNALMKGDNYNNAGDIRTYVKDGAFLSFDGVDKVATTNLMNNFLIGIAVNALYRTQKIFIMGGGKCGDGDGIGSGPQEAVHCRDGKAWYLYYWQENDVISTTAHQWGWVAQAPGQYLLGQPGDYAGVKVEDIISSSLDAYNVATYSYTADTAKQRAESALQDQWSNPGAQGPAWEGTFTIPVCDVSWAITGELENKEFILQPYGHDSRPNWCGPVCNGDQAKTDEFLRVANMKGFRSPRQACTPTEEETASIPIGI